MHEWQSLAGAQNDGRHLLNGARNGFTTVGQTLGTSNRWSSGWQSVNQIASNLLPPHDELNFGVILVSYSVFVE